MGSTTTLQLLTIIVLLCSSPPIVHGTTEYYVVPTEYGGIPCPGEPCHTLNHYASNIPNYTWSDVVVRFLPGNHSLNRTFHVSNKRNLQLTSFNPDKSIDIGSVSVHCTSEGNFHFKYTSNVTITGLLFRSVSATLIFDNANNFRIHCVIIRNSEMDSCLFGDCHSITIINYKAFGKSIISHSEFHQLNSSHNAGTHISIFMDEKYLPHSIQTDNHLIISKSIFKGASQSAVDVSLRDITSFFIEISESCITSNEGTGIVFTIYNSISLIPSVPSSYNSIAAFRIVNCSVKDNLNGGLYFEVARDPPIPKIQIITEDSIINDNIESTGREGRYELDTNPGAGMTMVMRRKVKNNPIVTIRNVSFIRNQHYGEKRLSSAISLSKISNIAFIDCTFRANEGSAIRTFQSDLYITGHNSFIDNSATEGGAMVFLQNSHLIVMNNTKILFLNNYAYDVGGAIFVQNTDQDETVHQALILTDIAIQGCSLLLLVSYLDYFGSLLNVTLNFTNNTGWNGGDVVYGEAISTCTFHQLSLTRVLLGNIQLFDGTNAHFNPDGNKSFSLLSSNPLRACICTSGRPECTSVFMNLTKYPGENFNISAVVVGENFGTVTGLVFSNFLPLGENRTAPKLEGLQHLQKVPRSAGCTELQYTVLSENVKEVMVLTAKDITTIHYISQYKVETMVSKYKVYGYPSGDILKLPVYITITLLPCPLGFMLHSSQHRCVCHSQLEEQSITCNISDQTVHRSELMWLNASFVGNTTNGFIILKYCPYGYCQHGEMNINLENPDAQCAFNHSGVLCGGCQIGLSLALGSSQCILCSNKYLTILIPFTLAGFVLVFFLTFLNLTVSQGTISGLIFYANIVKANQAVLFPPGDTNILTVFIAWLNLDLGIETCFADGLNGYWKTWLQFVFPVYIWIITAIIIVASHHSSMASKIFGNNSVPVLATLFLLSYAKLLRTIITVLTFTFLDYPDGSRRAVWS